jgi:hypothetical protein
MDEEIPTYTTPESYEQYALNVESKWPARAQEGRRRAVQLRAEARGAQTEVERKCLEAIFAYEWTLFKKHGKRQPASYTWRMVRERGIISAVEHVVSRDKETTGYRALVSEGMQEMAFEAVVVRYAEVFSAEAVAKSKKRLAAWQT